MTIKVGERIPSMKLMMATPEGPKEVSTDDIFKGKKVVLFAVPGAFTPTCSAKHLPGFVQNADAIRAKGVDTIACISVNDAFVMGAWGKDQGTDGKVLMLADGSAGFAKALGLELDLNARGMGTRSQRYALVAQDGKVTHLAVEPPGGFEVSKAEFDHRGAVGSSLRPVSWPAQAGHPRLAGSVTEQDVGARTRSGHDTAAQDLYRPFALHRHAKAGPRVRPVVPHCAVLRAAIVPERHRVLPPAEPALEQRIFRQIP